MAYGVLGLTPKEFGEMTLREFYLKVQGFGWRQTLAARARAEIICAIGNFSPVKKKGKRFKVDELCPINYIPPNIFFRDLFGIPR